MSLGLVVLEKLFTRTRTPTPHSDDIKTEGGHFTNKMDYSEYIDGISRNMSIMIIQLNLNYVAEIYVVRKS